MSLLYKATASQVVMLKLFLSSDHITAATGKTVAITISKNGGAFGNPNAGATNATEVSSGWYKVTLDATDTGTEGDLVVRGTAASCDDTERVFRVHLPANFGLTSIDANGRVDVIKVAGTSQTAGDIYARLGAPAGASMSADIASIKTDTGTTIPGRLPAALVGGRMDSSLGAIAAGVDFSATMKTSAQTATQAALDANIAEISAIPAVTAPLTTMIKYLFELARNKVTQDATTQTLFKDDGVTSVGTSAVSDAAGTFTRAKFV